MVSDIIECVPNVSEGRNIRIVDELAEAVDAVEGIRFLHVESGRDTNRTVYTYAGKEDAVEVATFSLVKAAVRRIDMRKHRGTHPRMGAVDVIPFIPLDPGGTEPCIALSHRIAGRIWRELQVPVYLYGKAALVPSRVRLPDIRKGQYENLERRMNTPEWKPDYGDRFNERAGASVVGVRDFMLAYNVNLDTKDLEKARYIAGRVRTSGFIEADSSGNLRRIPGLLKFCQADGWYLPEYGYCQVTMNLHNIPVTGIHDAFEAVKAQAAAIGVRVRGSELIGMIPLSALTAAGRYYLGDDGAPQETAVREAVERLGLNDSVPFEAEKRIIEYRLS